MTTLNWRGAVVYLTYRALEIALHYFFGFWPQGYIGKIKDALGNLKNGSSNPLKNVLQSSDGSWPWPWSNWYTLYEFDSSALRKGWWSGMDTCIVHHCTFSWWVHVWPPIKGCFPFSSLSQYKFKGKMGRTYCTPGEEEDAERILVGKPERTRTGGKY